jgi:hypothetical protein
VDVVVDLDVDLIIDTDVVAVVFLDAPLVVQEHDRDYVVSGTEKRRRRPPDPLGT